MSNRSKWNGFLWVVFLTLLLVFTVGSEKIPDEVPPYTKGKVVRLLQHGQNGDVYAVDDKDRYCEIYIATHTKVSAALERGETPEIECRWENSK